VRRGKLRFLNSVRFKVFVLVALGTSLVMAGADLAFYLHLGRAVTQRAAGRAEELLGHVARELLVEGAWLQEPNLTRVLDSHLHQQERIRSIHPFDGQGRPLARTAPDPILNALAGRSLASGETVLAAMAGKGLWAVARPVFQGGSVKGVLTAVILLDELTDLLLLLKRYFWVLGAGTWLVLILVLFWSLDRLVLHPLDRLSEAAAAFGRGSRRTRSDLSRRDEIGVLSRTFDQMADSLSGSITELEEERFRLRTVIDTLADFLFTLDHKERLVLVNRPLAELLELEPDQVPGRHWREVIPFQPSPALKGRIRNLETELVLPHDRRLPVRLNSAPLGDGSGRAEGMVATFIDLSQERELNRLRAEWDSFVRHEIKAPLTPIIGLSALILEQGDSLESSNLLRYLKTIHDSAKSLDRTLEMTREVQAYQAGEVNLEPIRADLKTTLEEAAREAAGALSPTSPEKEPEWRLSQEPGLETEIDHDPIKMRRVFKNLFLNAWEHHPGPVTVRIRGLKDRPGLEVGVHNWGPPLSPAQLETIFEKFNTTKKERGGVGLGTTIAKVFVEAHGGTIAVSSTAGQGTEFIVRLPGQRVETG
jgi:two-component system sensor histidine kinase ResE